MTFNHQHPHPCKKKSITSPPPLRLNLFFFSFSLSVTVGGLVQQTPPPPHPPPPLLPPPLLSSLFILLSLGLFTVALLPSLILPRFTLSQMLKFKLSLLAWPQIRTVLPRGAGVIIQNIRKYKIPAHYTMIYDYIYILHRIP